MAVRLSTICKFAALVAVLALALLISSTSIGRYITQSQEAPAPVLANFFARPWLFIHVAGAIVALVIGPLQFVSAIRRRWTRIHRALGLAYVVGCAIGGSSGLVLAFGSSAGPVAGNGFAVLAILQLGFTALGLRAAIGRQFTDHRQWMLRSYAMTAAAITLRLMIPASFMLGLDFVQSYRVIAWASWLTNLMLVEAYLRLSAPAIARNVRLAAA